MLLTGFGAWAAESDPLFDGLPSALLSPEAERAISFYEWTLKQSTGTVAPTMTVPPHELRNVIEAERERVQAMDEETPWRTAPEAAAELTHLQSVMQLQTGIAAVRTMEQAILVASKVKWQQTRKKVGLYAVSLAAVYWTYGLYNANAFSSSGSEILRHLTLEAIFLTGFSWSLWQMIPWLERNQVRRLLKPIWNSTGNHLCRALLSRGPGLNSIFSKPGL